MDDELVNRLRFAVARLSRLLRQQDNTGITPTMTALMYAIGQDGPITLGELAVREQVAPPTITKSVDKLETDGLVQRIRDTTDRRVCRVALSDAGHKQVDANRTRRN